jgi:hypothetical protein
MVCLKTLFTYFGVSDAKILEYYRKKHATNIARQKNNYAVATKTEIDNEAIEKDIASDRDTHIGFGSN